MNAKRFLARLLLASSTMFACFSSASASNGIEYAVKGAYLYKFLPFVEWPASSFPNATTPFTICILGRDPFGAGLDRAVADVRVDGRAIVIRRVDTADPACHVAYIGDGGSISPADFAGRPVLTVTDSGAATSGVVEFVIEGDHVRFDIDDAQAARDGLAISSKLLSLAHAVKAHGGQP